MNSIRFLYRRYRQGSNFPLRYGKNGTFVFIHINKTAGTSISKALGLPKKRHLTVKEVIDIIGAENYYKAFSFAVIRNPWAKVVSHYNYRLKTNESLRNGRRIEFNEWVKKTYGEDRESAYMDAPKMFMPQVEWLKDYNDTISVTKVIRFENLNKEITDIFDHIGAKNITLPTVNQTKKVDYRDYYNDTTREIINIHFKDDIRLFNYHF